MPGLDVRHLKLYFTDNTVSHLENSFHGCSYTSLRDPIWDCRFLEHEDSPGILRFDSSTTVSPDTAPQCLFLACYWPGQWSGLHATVGLVHLSAMDGLLGYELVPGKQSMDEVMAALCQGVQV